MEIRRCASSPQIGAAIPERAERLFNRMFDALGGQGSRRKRKASTPHPNLFDHAPYNPLGVFVFFFVASMPHISGFFWVWNSDYIIS